MKENLFAFVCASMALLPANAALPTDAAPGRLTFPQQRAATNDEVRRYQSLGRLVIAPDGKFFLYEWQRPYSWAPDNKGLAAAAARKETVLLKVDTAGERAGAEGRPSEFLFQPSAGATYYLGDLSPDGRFVSFYEIDRDDNSVRAGAVLVNDGASPRIVWFDAAPDSSRLESPALWIANDELAFPAAKGWVRGRIPEKDPEAPLGQLSNRIVKTRSCGDCAALVAQKTSSKAPAPAAAADKQGIPDNAQLLAQSADLAIYSLDTPDRLALMYRKGAVVETLFDNDRRPLAVILVERKKQEEERAAGKAGQ